MWCTCFGRNLKETDIQKQSECILIAICLCIIGRFRSKYTCRMEKKNWTLNIHMTMIVRIAQAMITSLARVSLCICVDHLPGVSGSASSVLTGMFERTVRSCGPEMTTSNVALTAGSSQQGKHLLASVDSNWVTAAYRSSPCSVYLLR